MKTVLITGANGNLGTAAVKKFLSENYQVIAVDAHDNYLEFASGNSNFKFSPVNLAQETETAKFIDDLITNFKRIDAALLLVGGFAMGSIEKTSIDDIQKMINLNFVTAYNAARPLFNHMMGIGYGRLVFVGARPALKAPDGKNMIAYALSKSLLFKLAEFLNAESKSKNVVTSVIVPSIIDTSINRKNMPDSNPEHWVKAEQIADLLEFICSEKGSPIREPIYKLYNLS